MPGRRLLSWVAVLLIGPFGVLAPVDGAEAAGVRAPGPVLRQEVPDPVVVRAGHRWVAFGTGRSVGRWTARRATGPWRTAPRALVHRPSWATGRGGIWGVDVDRVAGRWVMYFAAPVTGLGKDAHCIGVATSRSALGRFQPLPGPPLVCPILGSEDPAGSADATLPLAGAIDPNLFTGADGLHLLYKTDRRPSSIRVVTLDASGQHVAPGSLSSELIRSNDVVENPVLLAGPGGYVLLVSDGDWTRCGYRTDWYSSASLDHWQTAAAGSLVSAETSGGLCGPGGADVTETSTGPVVFLHGWTCHGRARPCRGAKKWDHHRGRSHAIRSLYAARLGWSGGAPVLSRWL